MTPKRTLLIICFAVMAALGLSAAFYAFPRQYYRYQGGHVYLVHRPDACWNGLWQGPAIQFTVPIFAETKSWKPSPVQIRRALKRFDAELSEHDITNIVRSCVPAGGKTL